MRRVTILLLAIAFGMTVAGCEPDRRNSMLPEATQVPTDNVLPTEAVQEPAERTEAVIDMAAVRQLVEGACAGADGKPFSAESMVALLGEAGYTAVDSANRIDMVNADRLLAFLDAQRNGTQDAAAVFQIAEKGDCILYVFRTRNGEVHVERTYYPLRDGRLEEADSCGFDASEFIRTDEGYLFTEGCWRSLENYLLTLSDEEEHIALRVTPLDAQYRELCEKYILPVSYGLNNLFLTSWNTDDWKALDFYDVFVKFYPECHRNENTFPYVMDDKLTEGREYAIPAAEFEEVVMRHLPVCAEELRKLLRYDSESGCYRFRPRGFGEFDYAEIPYPEVVACETDGDTLILTVNAVFPHADTARLFTHKVTVREEDDRILYLGNELVGDGEPDLWWHAERYSDDKWKEVYQEAEKESR